ncbi:MAG: sigma-70 family RNA polymerase sigma factor [Verrucomicrobiales bacterium]|jgi:RNA polymerase sigma-70 factor (ECF subfamily)|nr:sigma-70 family RNA polymerase sigma factor [Verrucomicrobiales bacterium]
MPQDDPDLPLVLQLQSGDDQALDELMARHQQRIHRFIWRYFPNEHDALELAQETFVRAYFNIHKFNPRALFSTWLFSIALNLCRDRSRSRAHKLAQRSESLSPGANGEVTIELSSHEKNPTEILEQNEKMRALEQAVADLPPELKEPFILSVLEGDSHRDCAAKLGLSEKAVEMKIYRARKILAEKIADF